MELKNDMIPIDSVHCGFQTEKEDLITTEIVGFLNENLTNKDVLNDDDSNKAILNKMIEEMKMRSINITPKDIDISDDAGDTIFDDMDLSDVEEKVVKFKRMDSEYHHLKHKSFNKIVTNENIFPNINSMTNLIQAMFNNALSKKKKDKVVIVSNGYVQPLETDHVDVFKL